MGEVITIRSTRRVKVHQDEAFDKSRSRATYRFIASLLCMMTIAMTGLTGIAWIPLDSASGTRAMVFRRFRGRSGDTYHCRDGE